MVTIIRLLALFSIIVTLVAVIAYGMAVSRRAKSETDKKFISRYFIILVITFTAGTIARTIQELTGSQWADALVPIFGGFFMLAIGWPLLFLPRQLPPPPVKRMLSWALAIFIALIAIAFFSIGFMQMLSILQ